MTRPLLARSGARRDWDIVFLAALTWPVALVGFAVSRVPVYATADAGISLASADTLLGRGIRPSGHLPVFAILTAAARLFVSDLGTFRLLAVVTSLALPVAFLFFLRGRTQSALADTLGALLMAVAPTTAEAVGWYGLTMLIGIAMALVALRLVDNWLLRPSQFRACAAGLAVILVSLAHSVPFLWTVQLTGLFVGGHVILLWWRERDWRSPSMRAFWRTAPTAGGLFALAALVNVLNSSKLQSAVALAPSLEHLRLITSFGFRHDRVWLAGLAFGLVGAPVLELFRGRNLRLAVWGSVSGWVAIVNLLILGGNESYENRQVYLLAACVGVGLAVLAARGALMVRQGHYLPGVAAVFLVVAVLGWSGRTFDHRLGTATRYYNNVSLTEVAGLHWLRDHPGGVLVAPSDADFFDGTTISWMTQGLARQRAISPTEGFRNLIESDRRGSDDAALILAGTSVHSRRNLAVGERASFSEVFVLGRFDESWLPLAALHGDAGPVSVAIDGPGRLTVHLPATATTLVVREPSESELRASPADFSAANHVRVRVGAIRAEHGTVQASVTVEGLEDLKGSKPREAHANALLRARGIRWIWTTRGSRSEDEFKARGLPHAFSNASVVIFDAGALRTP